MHRSAVTIFTFPLYSGHEVCTPCVVLNVLIWCFWAFCYIEPVCICNVFVYPHVCEDLCSCVCPCMHVCICEGM